MYEWLESGVVAFVLIALLVFLPALWPVRHKGCGGTFKRDPRGNPYRRHCRKCGRQQDYYETGRSLHGHSIGQWEDMY